MTTARPEKTLTAEGARLVRAARDRIVAHPEQFNRGQWGCGTQGCIAGHVLMAAGESWEQKAPGQRAVALLGFGEYECVTQAPRPVSKLFLDPQTHGKKQFNIQAAVADINAFLWEYGYPPSEVAGVEPAHDDAVAGESALTQADTSRC